MHARASGCTGVVGMLPLTTHPLFALLRMHRLAPRNDAAADSAVETLSPCVPGRRQCFSVPVRNVLSGQDGGYGGRVIGRVGPRNSPDGTAWTWQQCAAMCLNYDGYRASNGLADGETCVYFLLSVQKGCVMKANQEKFTANTGRNTVIGAGSHHGRDGGQAAPVQKDWMDAEGFAVHTGLATGEKKKAGR